MESPGVSEMNSTNVDSPTRPSTPPSRSSTMKFGHPSLGPAPSAPSLHQNSFSSSSNVMMGSEHAIVPPSPGVPVPGFEALTMSPETIKALPVRKGKEKGKGNARTGAGVQKQAKKKFDGTMAKLVDAVFNEKAGTSDQALQKPFRFMDLPGGKDLISDRSWHKLTVGRTQE